MSKEFLEDYFCSVEFVAIYRERGDKEIKVCGLRDVPALKLIGDAVYGAFFDGTVRPNNVGTDLEEMYDLLITCCRSTDDGFVTLSFPKRMSPEEVEEVVKNVVVGGLIFD